MHFMATYPADLQQVNVCIMHLSTLNVSSFSFDEAHTFFIFPLVFVLCYTDFAGCDRTEGLWLLRQMFQFAVGLPTF